MLGRVYHQTTRLMEIGNSLHPMAAELHPASYPPMLSQELCAVCGLALDADQILVELQRDIVRLETMTMIDLWTHNDR